MTENLDEKNNNQLFQSFCGNNILYSNCKNSEKKDTEEDFEFTFKKGICKNTNSKNSNIYSQNDQNIIQSGHFCNNKNEPSKFRTIIENDCLNKNNKQNIMKKYLFKIINNENLVNNLKKNKINSRNQILKKLSNTNDSTKLKRKESSLLKTKKRTKFFESKINFVNPIQLNKRVIKMRKQEKNNENINMNNILNTSRNIDRNKNDKNIFFGKIKLALKNSNNKSKNCYKKIKNVKKKSSPNIKEYFGKSGIKSIDYIGIHNKKSNLNKNNSPKMTKCNKTMYTMKYENNVFKIQLICDNKKKMSSNSLKKYKSYNSKYERPFIKDSNFTSKKCDNVLSRFSKIQFNILNNK